LASKILNHYYQTLLQIEKQELLHKQEFAIFKKRANYIKQQMEQQEFRVTVVGEFSAGKSTFLNALIGLDVLPHAVRETTASVTYIRNVNENHELVNKMVIEFTNPEREAVTLDIGSDPAVLKKYVTTMSNDFNVVNEIRAVHIYLDFPYTNDPIVFVDTPGLNGMAEGHYDLTLSEIQKAHASIFLFHIRGLSQSNIRLLRLLNQYQQKFIFVMNFIDELKSEEGESVDKKLHQLRNDLFKAGVTGDIKAYGVSALKALVSRDANIKRLYSHEQEDLSTTRRQQLMVESNFPKLENYLWNDVILKEKEKILKDSLKYSISQLLADLIHELEEYARLNAAKINHEEREEIERRIERLTSRSEKNWQTTEAYIGSRENDLGKMFREKIQEDMTVIWEEFESKVLNLSYLELDNFKTNVENNVYQKELSQSFSQLKAKYDKVLKALLEEVFHGAILKIRKYHPTIVINKNNKVDFTLELDEAEFENLDIVNQLKATKRKEKQFSESYKTFLQEKMKVDNEIKIATREIDMLQQKELKHRDVKNQRIKDLGSIPNVYYYEETRTRTVERASFSVFRLFGSTTKTEKYTAKVRDDSEQQKWKNKKANIENEYKVKIAEIRSKQDDYEERRRRLSRNSVENTHKLEQVNRKLAEYEKEVEYLEKLRKDIYEQNKREYFEIQKRDLLNLVRIHIEDVVLHEFGEVIAKNIESNMFKIKTSAKNYYIDSENKYRHKLLVLLQQSNHDFDTQLEQRIKETLQVVSNLLEELMDKRS
jgi:GTPase Era involved in 16S rRNA processing